MRPISNLLAFSIALLLCACASEATSLWRQAQRSGDLATYQLYLDVYPNGEYVGQAREYVAEALFEAEQWGTYVKNFPEGKRYVEAFESYHDLRWSNVEWRAGHEEGVPFDVLKEFFEEFPESRHVGSVRAQMSTYGVIKVDGHIAISRSGNRWYYSIPLREVNGVGVKLTHRSVRVSLNSSQYLYNTDDRMLLSLAPNETTTFTGSLGSGRIDGKSVVFGFSGRDSNGHQVKLFEVAILEESSD